MRLATREPQRCGAFVAGAPSAGYYNDLSPVLAGLTRSEDGLARLARLVEPPDLANHVSIAQLGLAAWQRERRDPAWSEVADAAARWLSGAMEDGGALPYGFPMRHTYHLPAPWVSAMAQGEVASLFARLPGRIDGEDAVELAERAVTPLLDARDGLVVDLPEGPVLQEYPTTPPSHVLNGWVFALWGLYDVSLISTSSAGRRAAAAFEEGCLALRRLLPRYRSTGGWSRYDLYPHAIDHLASPFYHRLHIAQLEAMQSIAPSQEFSDAVEIWRRALRRPHVFAISVGRKVTFRVIRPRKHG
jgi:hypothetical protein